MENSLAVATLQISVNRSASVQLASWSALEVIPPLDSSTVCAYFWIA
jgi:hypothetical protein